MGSQVNSVNRKLLFKSGEHGCAAWVAHVRNRQLSVVHHSNQEQVSRTTSYISSNYHTLLLLVFLILPQEVRSHTPHRWCQTLPQSHHRPGRGISFGVVSLPTKTMLLAGSQLDTETLWKGSRPLAWAHRSLGTHCETDDTKLFFFKAGMPMIMILFNYVAYSHSHPVVRSVVFLLLCEDIDILHK